MKNLSMSITHSLAFLTSTLKDTKDLYSSIKTMVKKLYNFDLDKEGSNSEIRKISKEFREDVDEDIEFILYDYELFQKEISEIVKNKADESVISILRRYRQIYLDFKELKKDIDKLDKSNKIRMDQIQQDKDYVRYIAVSKVSVPLYKINKIIEGCMFGLNKLVEEDK